MAVPLFPAIPEVDSCTLSLSEPLLTHDHKQIWSSNHFDDRKPTFQDPKKLGALFLLKKTKRTKFSTYFWTE